MELGPRRTRSSPSPCRSEITGQRERKSGSVGQCFGSGSGLDPDSISSVDADSEFRLGYGSTDVIEPESGLDHYSYRSVVPVPYSESGSGSRGQK